MATSAEVADYQARIFALEQALAVERGRHVEHLREIAAAAGLREAQAAGLLASRGGCVGTPNGGPGASPTDSEGSSAGRAPPPGAQEPARPASAAGKSKTELWLERTKRANAANASPSSSPVVEGPCADSSPNTGKMNRWVKRIQKEGSPGPAPAQPVSKMDRWLARQGKPPASAGSPASQAWSGGGAGSGARTPQSDTSMEEEQRLLVRIKDAWSKLDGVMALVADLQSRDSAVADGVSRGKSSCHKCGARSGGPESPSATAAPDNWGSGGGGGSGGGTQMGLRVEEKGRGLTVTHVVPGGQADQAGLEVKDVIKFVNGSKVSSLKVFGQVCQHSGDVVMLDLIRGSGSAHKSMTLYARTRPPTLPKDEDEGEDDRKESSLQQLTSASGRAATQEELMDAYNKSRAASGSPTGASAGASQAVSAKKPKNVVYNKYGKDTQLWVPDSDESGAIDAAVSKKSNTGAEPGGFFMFPPGHPDYVPLPPGEAALIAGRQHIHAEERLAPHWSNVTFKSPTGAEIRAQARHATYGIIAKVSGPLVNADPITAHQELKNADEISGCVAYIKRGGAPFTKKARVAVAAGACACVVANHDKETFGMSYTDDGLPFEALNIPCVMISVDIAEKLESSANWTVTLTPAKGQDGGKKNPAPTASSHNLPAEQLQQATSPAATGALPGEGSKPNGLRGLETLPINIKQAGAPLGKPGKKPTMWKKIKLLLP
jgi:hypothetical protein